MRLNEGNGPKVMVSVVWRTANYHNERLSSSAAGHRQHPTATMASARQGAAGVSRQFSDEMLIGTRGTGQHVIVVVSLMVHTVGGTNAIAESRSPESPDMTSDSTGQEQPAHPGLRCAATQSCKHFTSGLIRLIRLRVAFRWTSTDHLTGWTRRATDGRKLDLTFPKSFY